MKKDGLRPYDWKDTPNRRYAVRSHNYQRVLYVTTGLLEVILPDVNQTVKLRPGDQISIPANIRHGFIVGSNGVECLEAAIKK
jgi:quercetin dioxygenase-like cupin family protein